MRSGTASSSLPMQGSSALEAIAAVTSESDKRHAPFIEGETPKKHKNSNVDIQNDAISGTIGIQNNGIISSMGIQNDGNTVSPEPRPNFRH